MNLIETLKDQMNSGVVSSLGQKIGLSDDQVNTGISAGIPTILAGILKKGSSGDTGFLGKTLGNVTGAANDPDELLNGDHESLLEKGKSILGGLFGGDTDAVTNAVSNSSGISGVKAAGLLALITPLVTGGISKLMGSNGWSITDLVGKLSENKADITAALPQDLGSTLGLANINAPKVNIPNANINPPKIGVPNANYNVAQAPKSGGGFFKWLIPLLIILAAAWWFSKGCNSHKLNSAIDSLSAKADSAGAKIDSATGGVGSKIDQAKAVVAGKLNAAGDFVRELGTKISKKLPDGTSINIPENSVEGSLISFIEDKNKPVDKTTWFTFDRLYFETGKSILKPESQEQLKNIAAILKAYPNVQLKLGGYTDNTGDAAVNTKISNERANAALDALVKLGVDTKRLSAEGYGQEHPVASNDTPEGRAQNRRIDIRVTQK
jgi:outer membrane protein OmpA-like peptidoglycan-associated protein